MHRPSPFITGTYMFTGTPSRPRRLAHEIFADHGPNCQCAYASNPPPPELRLAGVNKENI